MKVGACRLVVCGMMVGVGDAFSTMGSSRSSSRRAFVSSSLGSSVVVDDDGVTPDVEMEEIEVIDELPEYRYDENNICVPHQSWRRGDTDGCEDPIEAEWRGKAEAVIEGAVASVGGKVVDVTWYMAFLVVTLEEASLKNVYGGLVADQVNTPDIRVIDADDDDAVTDIEWFDPEDPEPTDDYGIYAGEEDGRASFSANEDDGLPQDPFAVQELDPDSGDWLPAKPRPSREEAVRNLSDEEWELYTSETTIHLTKVDERLQNSASFGSVDALEDAIRDANDEQGWGLTESQLQHAIQLNAPKYVQDYLEDDDYEEPQMSPKMAMPALERQDDVDTDALGTVAKTIFDALQEEEDELQILSRHEVILTCPTGGNAILETQTQFDAHRGQPVLVETTDPFGSNRILKGTLVDRNALDIYINQKGRMVTIPQNMVALVRVPPQYQNQPEEE